MRWLIRFFIERCTWLLRFVRTLISVLKQKREVLYKTELDRLIRLLQNQLIEQVYYSFDQDGRAIVYTTHETIATIKVYSKGRKRGQVFVMVYLEDGYYSHKAWFQLAFLCFNVRFSKPILTLQKSWLILPREQ
jgi:hypothetical protein